MYILCLFVCDMYEKNKSTVYIYQMTESPRARDREKEEIKEK